MNNGKGNLTGEKDGREGWRRDWGRTANSRDVLKPYENLLF